VTISGAAEVLRPPEVGLPYLRLDRADELAAEPGSVTVADGRIAGFDASPGAELRIDATGCAVIPGFIDCHTHLPFAGWRAQEYGQKIMGVPYEEIARSGGGIRSSARAFAAASDEEVLTQASRLADEMLAHGTTTFECKSGYGLSIEAETRALSLAGALRDHVSQEVSTTALLAHAVPDGTDAGTWMAEVAARLPEILAAGEISALDIYVESVAFDNSHLRTMGALAAAHGLDLRAHVEQFNAHHSVPVAVEIGARSVDHLACMPAEEIELLARSETAAVLLPGAEFLGDERCAPARSLADAGAIGVLATDLNPGTSPVASIPLAIGLAVRRYRWSAREALLASTLNAAWVLRRSGDTGSLELGKRGDLLVLDGPIDAIAYRFGHNPVVIAIIAGEVVHVRPDSAWRIGR
jgi:imidazolonepropionase